MNNGQENSCSQQDSFFCDGGGGALNVEPFSWHTVMEFSHFVSIKWRYSQDNKSLCSTNQIRFIWNTVVLPSPSLYISTVFCNRTYSYIHFLVNQLLQIKKLEIHGSSLKFLFLVP